MLRPSTAALALVLAGCSGESGPGFTLTVTPLFIEGQDIVGASPDVDLVLTRPGLPPETYALGQAAAGAQLSAQEIEPVTVGTTVGLHATTGGETLAYGQYVVETDPGAAGALSVLVPQFGEVGKIDALADARQRLAGVAALLPSGDVYLIGGSEKQAVGFSDCSDRIYAMRETDAGGTTFDQLDTKVPDATESGPFGDETFTARCSATATVVTVEGRPMIFVAGGRPRWWDASYHTTQWFLLDPLDDSIFDQGNLGSKHSSHIAIPLRGGKILIWGGIVDDFFPQVPKFDVWNPQSRTNKSGGLVAGSAGPLSFGTTYGEEAVVCGGMTTTIVDGNNQIDWTPITKCVRLSQNVDVDNFDELPVPLAGAAMVELANGDLLVTGGVSEVLSDVATPPSNESAPALDTMYRHREGQGWVPAGAMLHARAHHQMLLLADGRVVIVGGTAEATAAYGVLATPVRCPELYDPADDSTVQLGCTDAGAGAFPTIATMPGDGVFVLEGYTLDGGLAPSGLSSYGFLSTGPPP